MMKIIRYSCKMKFPKRTQTFHYSNVIPSYATQDFNYWWPVWRMSDDWWASIFWIWTTILFSFYNPGVLIAFSFLLFKGGDSAAALLSLSCLLIYGTTLTSYNFFNKKFLLCYFCGSRVPRASFVLFQNELMLCSKTIDPIRVAKMKWQFGILLNSRIT